MRSIQTCRKTDCHGDRRSSRSLYHGFSDGIEYNETGITKYRNRYNPAHQFDSQLRMFLTYQLYHYICQLQSSTRGFEKASDHGTKYNDDTDTRKCG